MPVRSFAGALGVAVPLLIASGAQASSGGVHGLKIVKAHRANGHVCSRVVINGMNDEGTVIGTVFCGLPQTFVRTKSGKTKLYSLPKADAKITAAANISSNGIMAVDGQRKAGGVTTGYLVRPGGKVTVIKDPAAGSHSTVLNGVNRHGTAVGIACFNHKCSKQQSFVYRHGTFTPFTVNKRKELLPSLSEITDSGALIGDFYQYPNGNLRGFIRVHGHTKVIDGAGAGTKLGQGTELLGGTNHAACGEIFGAHHVHTGLVVRNGHSHVIALKPHVKKAFSQVSACNDRGEIAVETKLAHGVASYLGKVS